VTIFADPQPGTYTTVGASATGAGQVDATVEPFGMISTASADQPKIRYTSGGVYEVQLPGRSFERIVPYSDRFTIAPQENDATPEALLQISRSRDSGYNYSEIAKWSSESADRFGVFGFGVPTPEGAVPITGSANYSGSVLGEADVYYFEFFSGVFVREPVSGTVDLNFDFAEGALSGGMTLDLDLDSVKVPLGTFNFTNTVYSTGSTAYSGTFATGTAGENWFLGRFTGPHAEETVGAWALPFILNTSTGDATADNMPHQAFGAWIAKRH
jgi:hypothetical protein